MACIGRCLNSNWNFWNTHFTEAITLPQNNRAIVMNLFPEVGEHGWAIPDVYHNNERQELIIDQCEPAQCGVVARHVAEDLFYDKLKLAGVVVLGVVASAALIGVVAILAEVIVELTIEIFLSLGLLLIEWAGQSILAYIATGGVVVLTTGVVGFEIFNAYLAMLTGVTMIWGKVMVPNIIRGYSYFDRRNTDLRRLEFRAAEAVPAAQNQQG